MERSFDKERKCTRMYGNAHVGIPLLRVERVKENVLEVSHVKQRRHKHTHTDTPETLFPLTFVPTVLDRNGPESDDEIKEFLDTRSRIFLEWVKG